MVKKNKVGCVAGATEIMVSEHLDGHSGSFGDTNVFSFQGSKTMSARESGMLVTGDRNDLYDRCLILRDHCKIPGKTIFRNAKVEYEHKMSSMQTVLGFAKLERIEGLMD